MIEIQKDSAAFKVLRAMMNNPEAYLVRIEQREDGVALKRNAGVWTPTLSCKTRPTVTPRQPRSVVTQTDGDVVELQFGDERFR